MSLPKKEEYYTTHSARTRKCVRLGRKSILALSGVSQRIIQNKEKRKPISGSKRRKQTSLALRFFLDLKEMYYAICHPMKAKYICTISQAKKIILAIWIASFLLATPMLTVQNLLLSIDPGVGGSETHRLLVYPQPAQSDAVEDARVTLELVGVKHTAYWCTRSQHSLMLWKMHELYMLLLVLVGPTFVMAIAYSAICWEIWSVMQARYDMTTGKA
ncbi:hypothetical protein J6590_070239 [Homalodisca vitripennis]|nr:hypothetical protein J6590_070239 [Homalodisca vitripennis]